MTAAQKMLLGLVPAAYLIGSIPFGLIVGLWRGVDPREAGSGNIGATNVGRLLGGKFFALVFTLDVLKGLLPMLAAAWIIAHRAGESQAALHERITFSLWLLVGFAAILGHMFSVFLRFKGGKGVATSTGVVLGLYPYYTIPGLAAAALWGVVFKATRYVSVASISAVTAFAAAYLLIGLWRRWDVFGTQLPLLIFALLMPSMIVYKHRANIVRLRAGTESRFGKARSEVQETQPKVTRPEVGKGTRGAA